MRIASPNVTSVSWGRGEETKISFQKSDVLNDEYYELLVQIFRMVFFGYSYSHLRNTELPFEYSY